MQIMEGDVIRTIRETIGSIAHFHTAACPAGTRSTAARSSTTPRSAGRSSTPGYTGFLAQEFVPTDEPLRALEEAFRICDV